MKNPTVDESIPTKLELGNWKWISSSRLIGLTLTRYHQPSILVEISF